jgi:general secretion pathway protein D
MSLRLPRLWILICLASTGILRAQTTTPDSAPTAAPIPPPAYPPVIPIPKKDDILVGPIKMPDADIDTMLGALEIYTGRNILRPAGLPVATYNLKIDKPIPKSEAILAIETVLQLNGIGVVPLGDNMLKVVALQFVRTEAPEMIIGSTLDLPPSGKIATKIFMLNFLRVAEFIPQIQQSILSLNIGAGVVQLPSANAALITDTVSNLQRVEVLLQQVDAPVTAGLRAKFYPLTAAKASDVVTKLNAILHGPLQTQLGTSTTYSADDRTNQIILIADPRQHEFFDSLIAKLDIVGQATTRNEVIQLKHALSKDVATLLGNIISGQTSAAQKANAQSLRPGQGTAANNIQGGIPQTPPGVTPAQLGQTLQAPVAAVAAAPAAAVPGNTADTSGHSSEFSSLITVQSDDRTNSIVVSGTIEDINLIKELVNKLDILLAQVSIQVVIAEVTLTDTDISGISALNLTVGTDTPAGLGGDNGRGTHITNFTGTLGSWAVTSGVVNPMSFVAALGSNGSNSKVKVLQANTIITEHGKQGDFQVQQKQPTVTGVTSTPNSSATTGVTTQSNVTYQNVGVEVKVTPLIGADGGIELQIDQTVDNIAGNVTIDGNPTPIIAHREANVAVNVNDGEMIVLGGLQSNQLSTDSNKIGFLYEIPILSNLLGGRNNEHDRTELLLFVRPHILSPALGTADTQKSINQMSEKKAINDYLKDSSKLPDSSIIDRFVK